MSALHALYDKVSPGGYIIVDDYHAVEGCKKAVEDFIDLRRIKPIIEEIDGVGVFWRVSA
ncbi:Macrocin O-methyltransferase [compost metagenome]